MAKKAIKKTPKAVSSKTTKNAKRTAKKRKKKKQKGLGIMKRRGNMKVAIRRMDPVTILP